jgi:hypothetical protein
VQAKGWGEPNRNFRLGVYNGVLVNGGEAFFHSALVLAPFLAALGAPAWAIGLIPAMRVGGWFLPQLFVATRLAHVPFKLPLYRRTSTRADRGVRGAHGTVLFAGDRPELLVPLTLAMILVNSVAGGIGGVPFADVTAKVVPHYRSGPSGSCATPSAAPWRCCPGWCCGACSTATWPSRPTSASCSCSGRC